MLTRLDLTLDTSGERIRLGQSSLFHGWLLSQLPYDTAEELHKSQIHPYSQYLFYDGESWIWRIQTLTEKAEQGIIETLLEKDLSTINLVHSDAEYQIIGFNKMGTTYGELFEKNYIDSNDSNNITLRIITPMAFKSAGKYVRFPEPRYVFGSLINRFDAFSGNMIAGDLGILDEINEKVNVGRYNLSSSAFPLEGVRVPAFNGSITFSARCSKQFTSMLHMLADFGEYSGVGIKTSMGMGAIKKRWKGDDNT